MTEFQNNAQWHISHFKGSRGRALDIGACCGEFSKAAVGIFDHVVAVEPDERSFLVLGRIPGVEALEMAVVPDHQTNDWGLVRYTVNACSRVFPGLGETVLTIKLENLIEQYSPINYLKIDVEGMEHELFDHRFVGDYMDRVEFIQLEIHKTSHLWVGLLSEDEYTDRIERIIVFLQACGFRDDPCNVRKIYPGDFCSHNENFKG